MGTDQSIMLNNILDHLYCGVTMVERKGNIIFFNEWILHTFKLTYDEMLKAPNNNINTAVNSGLADLSISRRVFETGKAAYGCQKIRNHDGVEVFIFSLHTPIFDGYGNVLYSLGIVDEFSHLQSLYFMSVNAINEYSSSGYLQSNPELRETPIFRSKEMTELIANLIEIVDSDAPILLQGESGTGKEVIASFIHKSSHRREAPMIRVNCSAIPASLFESELFGYEKGSFTGAQTGGKEGLVEAANGGTLFLDEINSIPLELQGKLLRVIEEKKIKRLGSIKEKAVDFRIISATNENLSEMVKKNTFRMDLFFRLNVFPVTIPPLRDRKDDVEPLANYFLGKFNQKYRHSKTLSQSAIDELIAYDWPGNVRELKNIIERLTIISDNLTHTIQNVPALLFQKASLFHKEVETPILNQSYMIESLSLEENLEYYERRILSEALVKFQSPVCAASALGISQPTISRKIAKYNLGRYTSTK